MSRAGLEPATHWLKAIAPALLIIKPNNLLSIYERTLAQE
jgi:hypothetical protein